MRRQTHFFCFLQWSLPRFPKTQLVYDAIDGMIQQPQHPYTQLLVNSITVPDPAIRWEGRTVSSASEEVTVVANQGCKFYRRCPHAMDRCLTSPPPVYPMGSNNLRLVIFMMGRLINQGLRKSRPDLREGGETSPYDKSAFAPFPEVWPVYPCAPCVGYQFVVGVRRVAMASARSCISNTVLHK